MKHLARFIIRTWKAYWKLVISPVTAEEREETRPFSL